MPATTVRQRSDVPVERTWNAPSVFPTPADWHAEVKKLTADIPAIQGYQGRLAESPEALLEVMKLMETFYERAGKVLVYATLTAATNTADPSGAQMESMAESLRRRDVAQMFSDVQSFARRQPTAFLGASFLAGFVAMRFLRSSSGSANGQGGSRQYQAPEDDGRYGSPSAMAGRNDLPSGTRY